VKSARASQPYRLIFTRLRETGMRADEVLRLNVGDVILDPGHEGLRVREAKNNQDRMAVLDSDSDETLAAPAAILAA
jgi:integrase/recombinase XerD